MTTVQETSPADHKQRGIDKAAELIFDAAASARKAARSADDGNTVQAAALARESARIAGDAMNALTAKTVGAKNPLFASQTPLPSRKPKADPFDLSALETLDTPDARKLLALLEEAQAVADRVDESRGKALASSAGLLPGESRGTDLAEAVSLIALRLRTQIHGPTAGGRE